MTKYRVNVGLSYPTDARIVQRLKSGENIAWGARHVKEVAPGEIVEDIPEMSVKALLAKGVIEVIADPDEGAHPRSGTRIRAQMSHTAADADASAIEGGDDE